MFVDALNFLKMLKRMGGKHEELKIAKLTIELEDGKKIMIRKPTFAYLAFMRQESYFSAHNGETHNGEIKYYE